MSVVREMMLRELNPKQPSWIVRYMEMLDRQLAAAERHSYGLRIIHGGNGSYIMSMDPAVPFGEIEEEWL